MSTPLTIRPARLEDADGITEIIREPSSVPRLASEPAETTRAHVTAQLARCLADDSHRVYVAQDDAGRVIGYVAVHWLPYLIHSGPEGYVSELFIHSEARGQGLGKRLLDVIVQDARERGSSRLQLVNFRPRESYQRGFYTKAGWEERPDAASFVLTLT